MAKPCDFCGNSVKEMDAYYRPLNKGNVTARICGSACNAAGRIYSDRKDGRRRGKPHPAGYSCRAVHFPCVYAASLLAGRKTQRGNAWTCG